MTEVQARLDMVEGQLAAVEQRMGTGPDTSDLDEQIAQVCREKESAIDAQGDELAAELRIREEVLLASKAARQEQWVTEHPDAVEVRLTAIEQRVGTGPTPVTWMSRSR